MFYWVAIVADVMSSKYKFHFNIHEWHILKRDFAYWSSFCIYSVCQHSHVLLTCSCFLVFKDCITDLLIFDWLSNLLTSRWNSALSCVMQVRRWRSILPLRILHWLWWRQFHIVVSTRVGGSRRWKLSETETVASWGTQQSSRWRPSRQMESWQKKSQHNIHRVQFLPSVLNLYIVEIQMKIPYLFVSVQLEL